MHDNIRDTCNSVSDALESSIASVRSSEHQHPISYSRRTSQVQGGGINGSHDNMQSRMSICSVRTQHWAQHTAQQGLQHKSLITEIKNSAWKCLIGLAVAVLVLLLWCCCINCTRFFFDGPPQKMLGNATQTANASQSVQQQPNKLQSKMPFLAAYLSAAMLILLYPIYLGICCVSLSANSEQIRDLHRLNMTVLSGEYPSKKLFLLRGSLLTCLWMVMQYSLYRSLIDISSMEEMTLFAAYPCLVYFLDWVVLQNKFIGARIISFLLGCSGVILHIYLHQASMLPRILAAIAAACFAVFRTTMDKLTLTYIPSLGQFTIVMSVIGLFSLVSMWPLQIVLSVLTSAESGIENVSSLWHFAAAAAASNAVLFFVLQAAQIVTFSALAALGVLFAVPAQIFIEQQLRAEGYAIQTPEPLPAMRVIGIVLISVALLLSFVPPGWHKFITRVTHLDRYTARVARARRIVR